MRIKPLLTAIMLVIPISANAKLIGYTFHTKDGQIKTQGLADKYANPDSSMQFTLVAGIDRKVGLRLEDSEGNVIINATSHLLGADDRIILDDGKTYYGVILDVERPADGAYTAKSIVYSADGKAVETETFSLTIDTTPAQFAGKWDFYKGSWGGGTIDNFDYLSSRTISFTDVSDMSGIVKAEFFAELPGSQEGERSIPADYDADQKKVWLRNSTNYRTVFHTPRQDYTIGFRVTDKAGNISEIKRLSGFNGYCGTKEISHIFNPNSNQWEPYTSGMTAYENPVKFRVRVPLSEHIKTNDSGRWGYDFPISYQDDQYAYRDLTSIRPSPYTYYTFHTDTGHCGTVRMSNLNVVLADEVDPAPKYKGIEYRVEGEDWINSSTIKRSSPYRVEKMRFKAEPRSYEQTATMSGYSCTINPGESYCDVDVNVERLTGRGYSPLPTYLKGLGITVHTSYLYTYWDLNSPVIEDALIDGDKVSTVIFDFDTVNDWRKYMWQTNIRELQAINIEDYSLITLPPIDTETPSHQIWKDRYDLSGLPDGVFDLRVRAEDSYGNETVQDIGRFISDKLGPEIVIDIPEGNAITKLDDITVSVSDSVSNKPTIKSVRITEGPAIEDIYVAVTTLSENTYQLEYPIMFPSMTADEAYTVTVVAEDELGNVSEVSERFEYIPAKVSIAGSESGKAMIPAVSQEMLRQDGGHIIESEPLLLSDGSHVQGTYEVFATLRSDASVPLIVNGILIEPGKTTSLNRQHDFSQSGGKISLSVYPSESGIVGSSTLMISSTAPNAPMMVADIETWLPDVAISAPSVRKAIDNFEIAAWSKSKVCRFTTDSEIAKKADLVEDPVCLIEWDSKPEPSSAVDLKDGDNAYPALVGQATEEGDLPFSYSLYIFSGNGDKVKVGAGNGLLNVTSAYGSVAYKPAENIESVSRIVQKFDVRLEQTKGPDCQLTLDADRAKKDAPFFADKNTNKTCLLEWTVIPEGLMQNQFSDTPELFGSLENIQTYPLKWQVSMFSATGEKVFLSDEQFDIKAVNPEAPGIVLDSDYRITGDLFGIPVNEKHLGDALIAAHQASLDVAVLRGTSELEAKTHPSTKKMKVMIDTDSRGLWQTADYKVSAAFTRIPEVRSTAQYKVLSTPSESIFPVITIEKNRLVNTDLARFNAGLTHEQRLV